MRFAVGTGVPPEGGDENPALQTTVGGAVRRRPTH
jgi:hypothetical protein